MENWLDIGWDEERLEETIHHMDEGGELIDQLSRLWDGQLGCATNSDNVRVMWEEAINLIFEVFTGISMLGCVQRVRQGDRLDLTH